MKLVLHAVCGVLLSCSPWAAARQATLVMDADSGVVLHAQEATQRWYPASLTKMMTIYLTFAALEAGTLLPQEKLTASAHAAAQPDSRLGLNKGDAIGVNEAILAVITQSANDAAVVLAERIAGDEGAFAGRMTAQAHALGMTRTTFRNATGLPDDEQTTSARDMALLAQALIRNFPQHYHYFGARNFAYRGIGYSSINRILGSYAGADGLKTGFTCGSGYNLVASAKRGNRRLIGVVLGAASGAERTATMTRLLNEGFSGRPAGAGELIAALSPPQGIRDEPPPFRFKPTECRLGTGIREASARTLPGWGLLFGVFQDQPQAQGYIEKMRAKLKPVVSTGQPALVKRQVEDVVSWKALLVGLKQQDAINACLHLIKTDNICLVQSPRVLNPPVAPVGRAGEASPAKGGKKR